jgi:hypothetical protein
LSPARIDATSEKLSLIDRWFGWLASANRMAESGAERLVPPLAVESTLGLVSRDVSAAAGPDETVPLDESRPGAAVATVDGTGFRSLSHAASVNTRDNRTRKRIGPS